MTDQNTIFDNFETLLFKNIYYVLYVESFLLYDDMMARLS